MKAALRSLLNRFPRLKAEFKRLRKLLGQQGGVSSNYVLMKAEEAVSEAVRLRDAWQSNALPHRQRELVNGQLAAYRNGESIDVFDVMIQALRVLPTNVCGMSVLEVGCSSGFYSEVFEIAGLAVSYVGCDYSEAFIGLARQKYPTLRFDVEDATALKYAESVFDIVISGCCLLHIPEYEAAVAETARVARRYVIFHRTPVVLGQPNVYYRKQAYGVETMEIHFNEPQFLELLARQGLELIAIYTLDESVRGGVGSANRTYVCKKVGS
ncbi:class I SAM-dependent methyltransferase [Castellaniella sp. MT123]|uniref:class I SAM-dependent methyltransferase n=1 Tax=Castellaniella sp. MT123 TaxID=3140381 RepID=UPI0031F3C376